MGTVAGESESSGGTLSTLLRDEKMKKTIGYFALLMVLVAWVGQSEVTRQLQVDDDGYDKPFLLSWINHTVAFVLIPIQGLFSRSRGEAFTPTSLAAVPRVSLLKSISILSVVYLVGDYLWYRSLSLTTVGIATALFNTTSVFVYVLSVLFLKEKVTVRKVGAVAVATAGVVVFSTLGESEDGSDDSSTVGGNMLCVMAAFMYSVYEVYFKIVSDKWGTDQVSAVNMIVGYIAVFTGVTLWPFIVILNELPDPLNENFTLPNSDHVPGICGSALGAVAFNIFFGISLALLRPVVVSVGVMTTIPITAGTDYILHGDSFNEYQGLGAFLVLSAFVLLNDEISAAVVQYYRKVKAKRTEEYAEVE